MTSQRQAYAALDAVKHRAVRRIAQEDSEASAALFHLAARDRASWTLADWNKLLAELDACKLPVGVWIEQLKTPDWRA